MPLNKESKLNQEKYIDLFFLLLVLGNCRVRRGSLGRISPTVVAKVLDFDIEVNEFEFQMGRIYGSNITVWHVNCMQANDLCSFDLLEIELLDNSTVSTILFFTKHMLKTQFALNNQKWLICH